MRRTLDTGLVLAGWDAMEPSSGFADRVLAACDSPLDLAAHPARPWRRYAVALAAVCVLAPLAPLLFSGRGSPQPVEPSVIARSADLDAGLQTD